MAMSFKILVFDSSKFKMWQVHYSWKQRQLGVKCVEIKDKRSSVKIVLV